MDRERRYFISTAGSFEWGTPYQRCCWRQVNQEPNAAPQQVMFTIPQPKIAEMYYATCGAIDSIKDFVKMTFALRRRSKQRIGLAV
jgi:hypothetical protein